MSEQEYVTDQGFWSGPTPEQMADRVAAAAPTAEQMTRFMRVRAELFAAIAKCLAEDGHCKSYEGALAIEFPNYFEDASTKTHCGWHERGAYAITLHCYLIGPNRHYRWEGVNFEEVLHKYEVDVRAWIEGDYSLRHDERD